MFQTPIANIVSDFNQQLCANGARYVLLYVDADILGQLNVRCSSNYQKENIGPLLGSMLEAGEAVKEMLSDLFKAHPMRLPEPIDPEAPEAPPKLVEVPVEQAVAMVLDALLTNLQLRGAKPASPLVLMG
jgi:hypothetical protein